MSFDLQRSNGGTQVRNSGGTKNYSPPLGATQYGMAVAMIPIWGFGKFSGAWNTNYPNFTAGNNVLSYTGFAMFTEEWPNVYTTLTESWSDSATSGSAVTTLNPYYDDPITQTGSGSVPAVQSFTTPAITVGSGGLSMSATYIDLNGNSGTYTASVSNPVMGGGTTFATFAGAASTLLAALAIPAVANNISLIQPITTGSQTFTTPIGGWGILACASGLPGRWNSGFDISAVLGISGDTGNGLTIADAPTHNAPFLNCGFVLAIKSTWLLNGSAPSGLDPYNHLTIYGQESTGPVMSSAILTPSTVFGYPNPVAPGTLITFLETDLTTLTGYGAGLVGFHPVRA